MKFYLTTPLYYVNAAPHIGHTYTTVAADAIKRFRQLKGDEVFLTTGTDEHGQKVERSATAAGKTPEAFADAVSAEFRRQWDTLGIAYDAFIRTTDPKHHHTVQWLFQRCLDNGYIYKGSYTGQYCVFDELYVNDAKPGDNCPDCGRLTETVTEENYFFKLSAFTERLLRHYEEHPTFIQPEAKRNEVLSFVRAGLNDLSISRSNLKWGIPLPVEGHHVFYVWFDALIGYMSAVSGSELWPADLHLVGKEIVRFHAIFWPAFLMAAALPLPKQIFAHGWLLFENDKMSKSRGNIVRAEPIREVMGFDALRYFLLREIVFGQDGSFSYDALIGRYNAELANGLGNLVSRTLTMINQYRGGIVPAGSHAAIEAKAKESTALALCHYEAFEFSKALEAVWSLLSTVDQFIVQQAPWKLSRSEEPGAAEQLNNALASVAECLRIACILLFPVLPESTNRIWSQLGCASPLAGEREASLIWGSRLGGQKIGEILGVFPRIELKEAVAKMRLLEEKVSAEQRILLGKPASEEAPAAEQAKVAPPSEKITFDDFAKVDLRVGLVLSAEAVKGSDKLLHLKVDIAEPEPRTIVAGIALAYPADQLVGRRVVIVANLEPRKLRGISSNGMIVAASLEGERPVLAGFLEDVPVGARLK